MKQTKKSTNLDVNTSRREDAPGYFELQNRRFLGNKFKLLGLIARIIDAKCHGFKSLCDIFAGTGVVGARFNKPEVKIIANDTLLSNYLPLATFLGSKLLDLKKLERTIHHLNRLTVETDNYFSEHYGNTYFTLENARKIGAVRDEIETIAETEAEKQALITSLLYAADKVANTVGHYDAFRKKLEALQPVELRIPKIIVANNSNNEVYREDANELIRKIECDVLYVDPPYNSRQYCDTYHVLENLATWQQPQVFGKARKMDRTHLKSQYCLKQAPQAFAGLIRNANCAHILISYNNTGDSKDIRSNARITDDEIIEVLSVRGNVEIFEQNYQAFTAGKSDTRGNAEHIFYCKVAR